MTLFTVYEPGVPAPDLSARAEALAFVKDGFSWPALFVPALWLLYHRMWIELIVFVLLVSALPLLLGMGREAETAVALGSFGLSVLLAMEGNDLRRRALERKGYRLIGLAMGKNREEAELSFLHKWLPAQAAVQRQAERVPRAAEAPLAARGAEGEEVIGLFPRPE